MLKAHKIWHTNVLASTFGYVLIHLVRLLLFRTQGKKVNFLATFVLVHGAWHGAWCWGKVVSLLESKGHRAHAIDLPGSGNDKTPVPEVTLEAYAQKVCRVLDAQPEPVVLVGHSLGGITISQAAEYRPQKIKTLVYLTAFLLQNGQSRFDVRGQDPESLATPNTTFSEDNTYTVLKKDAVKEVFYGDCSEQDVAKAKALLCPQALAPSRTPMHLTEENFGCVPRVYIECLNDKAVSPSMQKKMYTQHPAKGFFP